MIATFPKPKNHGNLCRCDDCKKYVDGLREQCAHCKHLFTHEEILYRPDYTPLCADCHKLPVLLTWNEKMVNGLLTGEEIRNFNSFHDM